MEKFKYMVEKLMRISSSKVSKKDRKIEKEVIKNDIGAFNFTNVSS